MIFQQACRARTDNGYAISARSDGLTLQNENNIGSFLNDSMNSLFSGMGDSIFTCTQSGDDVLLARSTMSADILSRRGIFSHVYLVPLERFYEMVQKDPESLFSFAPSDFYTAQPANRLPTVDSDALDGKTYRVSEIRKRYGMTDERFAELVCAAYRVALGENLSLELSDEIVQRYQELTDLVYCILQVLPPSLRKNISFSSAGDDRVSINALPWGSSAGTNGRLFFSVDPRHASDVAWQENTELENSFYLALSGLSDEELPERIGQTERNLKALGYSEDIFSIGKCAAAYILASRGSVEDGEAGENADIVCELVDDAQLMQSDALDEKALAPLILQLYQSEYWDNVLFQCLVERYLQGGNEAFRESVQQYIRLIPDREALLFAGKLYDPRFDAYHIRSREIIFMLIERIYEQDFRVMNAKALGGLVRWVIAHDEKNFAAGGAAEPIKRGLVTAEELHGILDAILTDAEGVPMNESGAIMTENLLNALTEAQYWNNGLFAKLAERYVDHASDDIPTCVREYATLIPDTEALSMVRRLTGLDGSRYGGARHLVVLLLAQIHRQKNEVIDRTMLEWLIEWASMYQEERLTNYMEMLLYKPEFTAEDRRDIAGGILRRSEGRSWTGIEWTLMNSLLKKSGGDTGMLFDDRLCRSLDGHWGDGMEGVREAIGYYCMTVRFNPLRRLADRETDLVGMRSRSPEQYTLVLANMKRAPADYGDLLELIEVEEVLPDGTPVERLYQACAGNNLTKSYSGAFESRFRRLWKERMDESLHHEFREKKNNRILARIDEIMTVVNRLNLSDETKDEMFRRLFGWFWNVQTEKSCEEWKYDDNIYCEPPEEFTNANGKAMLRHYRSMKRVFREPQNGIPEEIRKEAVGSMRMRGMLFTLAWQMFDRKNFFSWDALLLASMEQEEGDDYIDISYPELEERVQEVLKASHGRVPDGNEVEYSALLRDDAQLRRQFVKKLSGSTVSFIERFCKKLEEYDKKDKTSFGSLFGGAAKKLGRLFEKKDDSQ